MDGNGNLRAACATRRRVNFKVMTNGVQRRLILLLGVVGMLGGLPVMSSAQVYTPPPPPLTTLPPCPIAKNATEAKRIAKRKDCDPNNRPAPALTPATVSPAPDAAAKKFPYPGEQPAKAADVPPAKAFPYPGDSKSDPEGEYTADPNVAHDAAAEKKASETSAGKAFPYPGDPAPAGPPEASSSTSSSSDDTASDKSSPQKGSSDDDDESDQPKLADKGSEGTRNRKTAKPQSDSDRVDEDLSVAKFYGQSGNSMGAYLRAKDAAKIEPDLPEARFVLGEAAKRLRKMNEAKAEFSAYLKLAPDGEHAKAAERALTELR